jgi:hypothetical protein
MYLETFVMACAVTRNTQTNTNVCAAQVEFGILLHHLHGSILRVQGVWLGLTLAKNGDKPVAMNLMVLAYRIIGNKTRLMDLIKDYLTITDPSL